MIFFEEGISEGGFQSNQLFSCVVVLPTTRLEVWDYVTGFKEPNEPLINDSFQSFTISS